MDKLTHTAIAAHIQKPQQSVAQGRVDSNYKMGPSKRWAYKGVHNSVLSRHIKNADESVIWDEGYLFMTLTSEIWRVVSH